MFSGKIYDVRNTKFLTGIIHPSELVEKGGKTYKQPLFNIKVQLNIYTTQVSCDHGVKLVIPYYSRSFGGSLIQFNKLTEIFNDIDSLFNIENTKIYEPKWTNKYDISVLDYEQLRVETELYKTISQFYKKDYKFIVLDIEAGNGQLVPIIYVSELGDELFIPTRKYVIGNSLDEVRPEIEQTKDILYDRDDGLYEALRKRKTYATSRYQKPILWDHEIYVFNNYNINKDPVVRQWNLAESITEKAVKFNTLFNWTRIDKKICIPHVQKLTRIYIDENYKGSHDIGLLI